MVAIFWALAAVFLILVASELLWRLKVIKGETSRKLVHICVGSFVAFWPYFMTWQEIQLISLAFLVVVGASMRLKVFHSIHDVKRQTWGEVLFPVGIGACALITPAPIVFTAAILHLSLADGLAALIGVKLGLHRQYKVRSYVKTLAGTLTFFLMSLIIILVTVLLSGTSVTWAIVPVLVWLPLAATVVENFAGNGTDNLFVPLLIVVVLQAANIS